MDLPEFEKIINESFEKIPAEFRNILKKEKIKLLAREKVPAPLKVKYSGSVVFGVFVGVPYTERTVFNIQQEPTRIELYKESFEQEFSSGKDMQAQIVKTVVHEIGHYFGFSEKELRKYL